ncbi:MmgE/PrpD family protein [Pararoseomonas indoligenes]|uniref:MmgE/PrpD family protein n=1 Tax=Roseomonas indoligenes TaxID=2820811 RepID=A0A940MZ64_9PROT|nr:MmgE/PrpD family protein [Pararoseomonas indoligenes]MBP0493755.1 MmgE/PrpD family protein [Pararoseomonas indoligenes]
MTAPALQDLAEWVAAADGAAGDGVVESALACSALDWAGALIAGTAHDLYPRYIAAFAAMAAPGAVGCAVAGDVRGWAPVEAAAANAAISHLWEFDDSHRAAMMHPGITVWPAVVALAQARPGVTVADMRAAVLAGYEAGLRIGAHLGKAHAATNHVTATAGTFGAAAAAARLLRLDAAATLSAFGHTGTQAAGLWQFLEDGATEAKAVHPAAAVRNGVTAAMLAEAGIPGAAHVLEGRRGMLAAWKLTPEPGASLAPEGPPMILTATIKGWPVCGQMHSLLDATQDLVRKAGLRAEEIATVRAEAPQALLDVAGLRRPANTGDAKFSTSFCLALMLSGGDLSFTGFDGRAVRDEAVQALADRIEVQAIPEFSARYPRERPARITVTTGNGRALSEERSFRRGDPEAPWEWEPLVERFQGIAGLAMRNPAAREAVVAWCRAFGAADPALDRGAAPFFRAGTAPERAA